MRVLAICGSLQAKSGNLALLKTAAASMPPGVALVLFDGLRDLPHFIVAGQPIVAAFPGWVYGNRGWFRERVIEPVMAGRRVLRFARVSLLATIAFVAIVSVFSTTVGAQVAQGSTVVVHPEVSDGRVSLTNLVVNLDPFRLRPVGASPATRLAMRSDQSQQARTSTGSGARARSKKRIVAGAIAGGVGGFFAGGFLGAHIEGDRCNCDDPGVRGFLIGAPIGAVAGGIVGAKFIF